MTCLNECLCHMSVCLTHLHMYDKSTLWQGPEFWNCKEEPTKEPMDWTAAQSSFSLSCLSSVWIFFFPFIFKGAPAPCLKLFNTKPSEETCVKEKYIGQIMLNNFDHQQILTYTLFWPLKKIIFQKDKVNSCLKLW